MEVYVVSGGFLFVALWIVAIIDAIRNRPCPYCLKKVHKQATRCPYCTSQLEPAPPSGPDAQIAARRAGGPPPMPGGPRP
jgi:hypothetical protein